ncbi:MAG: anthranilate phosphoribosyltransferase [Halobacteriales archaeon]|nr:anthranilate phosphoribosyltransferase [Halobacteriales archaeon]
MALAAAPTPAPPEAPLDFAGILDRLLEQRHLGEAEAERLMGQALEGSLGPERLAALVVALRAKPVEADELVGFARAMRTHACPLPNHLPGPVLDTCGTGGSPRKTFNISTAAALVAASAGIAVAKHGNRSVTRPSGSADVVEAAGGKLEVEPEQARRLLRTHGFAFLFAPAYHPAMRHAAPVRKALGVRTIFNLLGPLANPAGATHHVLGVADPALMDVMAEALLRLGCEGGYVLHGAPGFDEATPCGPVSYVELRDGARGPRRVVDPRSLGVEPCTPEALAPVPREEAPALLSRILSGEEMGARGDAVALNAAFALVACGKANDLPHGVDRARSILRSGVARHKWEAYLAATRSPA